MKAPPPESSSWSTYLQRFHAERPGITERILDRCRAAELDPYQWCADGLTDGPGPLLDLACGSGPMADRRPKWIGVDTSQQELGLACDRQRGPVMLASASCLPIRTRSLHSAVCSMSMQIIDPFADALSELARVLTHGGRAVLLLPANGPVPWRHAVVYGRLQVALRRRIRYPNDGALRSGPLHASLAGVGLAVVRDERLAFTLPLDREADVADLLASMYLPGVEPRRLDAGRRVLAGSIGRQLTVPLRRIVIDRTRLDEAGASP